MRWEGVGTWRTDQLVADLRRYIEGDYPIYPTDDPHCLALHEFLFAEEPDPRGFLPLFTPHQEREVTPALLRRDVIASTILTSFMRRAVRKGDPWRRELYDVVVEAGLPFAFDRVYGEAHTETSVDISDFFGSWEVPPNEASRAALARHLPALLARWRQRVTNKGSSTLFGIVLRHLGRDGAEALAGEWGGMNGDERYDLVERLKDEEAPGPRARRRLVEALLDESVAVRVAAARALRAQGAPVGDLDGSAPDEELERAAVPLRRWAARGKP